MEKAKMPNDLDVQCESIKQFLKGFHSEATKESYARKLSQFLQICSMKPDEFLAEAQNNPKRVQRLMIDFVEERRDKVSGSTINQSMASLKHFFEMNDAEDFISWKKITKIMPRVRKTGSDRAPTIQEIRSMLGVADTRIKCIILVCASSGMRVGGFEGMRWGDLMPMYAKKDDTTIVAARLIVYRDTAEEYVTFVSPECYDTLLKYKAMRENIGEQISDSSPLLRDSWDTNLYRKDKRKDPRVPAPLASKTISNMMGKFLKKINMRNKNQHIRSAGHEFKQVHGFRKYFKTNAERTMKTIDVEKLMGHAENYYKPPVEYLLEQYVQAVPNLIISEEAELKRTIKTQMEIGDKKVGEIERENTNLHERIANLENSYSTVREILENVLVSKTKT